MKFTQKTLYRIYNLNLAGARTLMIKSLESGQFAGKPLKEEYKEQDKIHLDILKNWSKKSKSERLSFIDDLLISPPQDEKDFALQLVSESEVEIMEKIHKKKQSLKDLFRRKKEK